MKLKNGLIVKFKPKMFITNPKFANRIGMIVNVSRKSAKYSIKDFEIKMLDEDPNERPWYFELSQCVDFDVVPESVYKSPLWKAMNED
jgi:hypothetical protein